MALNILTYPQLGENPLYLAQDLVACDIKGTIQYPAPLPTVSGFYKPHPLLLSH